MDAIKKWAAKPITEEMDLLSVVLTTVLIVTLAFLWTRVLGHITPD